jgi:type I restriction enzyme M protein
MPNNNNEIEKRLWDAADQLRANSALKSSEYSVPVLGLIFLRYADFKFINAKSVIEKEFKTSNSRQKISKLQFQAKGVVYLPEEAQFSYLLNLPEKEPIGKHINTAMKKIEEENANLKDVLPKTYTQFENDVLWTLLKSFSSIPMDVEGDLFGKIYEYFLGNFAMKEGQKGGEFFTPISIVKLIVEIIEPYHGKILDPASGSGGMFVQSAKFISEHKKNPNEELSIYGQEKTAETIRLAKMNLAVHGLEGDIRQTNTYYEDVFDCVGKFDFVMANPPFNVNGVDKEKIVKDKRYAQGLPRNDNGNYLWIQIFFNALNEKGRAGFVMANSAGDARQSEFEIRKKFIDENTVDVIISVAPNFFYTVILPCTLWFFDKGKKQTSRKDKVLFIDARNIFTQIDRAHREYTSEQIQFITSIVKLYREEKDIDLNLKDVKKYFPKGKYIDIAGLCKVATIKEISEQNYSLNPGRYVGVTEKAEDDFDFYEKIEELNEELEVLNAEARELEDKIAENIVRILS